MTLSNKQNKTVERLSLIASNRMQPYSPEAGVKYCGSFM